MSKIKMLFESLREAESDLLYGASLSEWDEVGALDDGGLGFDTHEFNENGLGEIAVSNFSDANQGVNTPDAVHDWEKKHHMAELAAEEAKKLGCEDEYLYVGGVFVYPTENGYSYKVLIAND